MSDTVEQLRAQSNRLRNVAHPMLVETDQQRAARRQHEAEWRSLADLIDGMLGRHRPGGGSIGLVCMQDGPPMPCADLVDLARHVSAVLSGCQP